MAKYLESASPADQFIKFERVKVFGGFLELLFMARLNAVRVDQEVSERVEEFTLFFCF
jgi:hypothetical protein